MIEFLPQNLMYRIVKFLNCGVNRSFLIREADGRHTGFLSCVVQVHFTDFMACPFFYKVCIYLKLPLILFDLFVIFEKIRLFL